MKEIKLSQGKTALIDDDDLGLVGQFKWYALKKRNCWYARCHIRLNSGKKGKQYMHTLIMGTPKGMQVDHINNDALDNRRGNLRLCRAVQNAQNRWTAWGRSKYKGVWFRGDTQRWTAEITAMGKRICLGCFDTEELAAAAYDKAALKHHGQFACTNRMMTEGAA